MVNENMSHFVREAFLIRTKDKVIDFGPGEYAKVEFPFEKNWEVLRGFPPHELCFMHVHPASFPRFSGMDRRCYAALKRALGGDFAFGIIWFDSDGHHLAFYNVLSAVLPDEDVKLLKVLSQEASGENQP